MKDTTHPCDETTQPETNQTLLTKVLLLVADRRDDEFAQNSFQC